VLNPLRRVLPLLACAVLALAVAPALAAPPAPGASRAEELTLAARPAYEGAFRPGSWLPIVVDLENAGVDRVVEVRVGTREGAQYATRVDLPNGGRKSLTVYAYLTTGSRRLTVRVLSDGAELAAQPITLQPANPNARVVGVVVAEGAAPRPPARLSGNTPLTAVGLAPADLPDNALGLSGFGSLLIEDVDTGALSEAQRAAIRAWVLRGGQLILGGGQGLERTLASLPPELAPAFVEAVEPVAAELLFGPAAAGLAPVPYAALAPRPADDGRPPYQLPLSAIAAEQPAIEQTAGRGAVTVLAFPLSHPALAGWDGAPELWRELLRAGVELPAGFAPENVSADNLVEGNVAAALTSLPALEFPPLGLLAGLVAAYIVLVGPVTYLVLRRLDRQAWGWAVVPAITLVFAGLTYGVGFAQRGGDVVLNQIALIEPIDELGGARVRAFVGVFSPERRAYSLDASESAGGAPLLRPISVQGPWDTSGSAAGGVFLQDVAAGAAVDGFEVAQWSMRAMAADSIVADDFLTARVVLDGDTVTGEATNTGAVLLRDVALVQGDRVARLGDLAPGETKGGELRRRQGGQAAGFGASVPVSYLVYGEEMDQQSRMGGQPLPLELQQRVRLLDAIFNYGPSTRGGQPLFVAWADSGALRLTPSGTRADEQRSAIITGAPRLELAGTEVTLGAGWLAPRFEGSQATACFGGQGSGVTLGQEPAVLRLTLPRDLYGLRPTTITLVTASDAPWIDGTTVELFNWQAGVWEAQPTAARQIPVADPGRFLSSHGVLRVRVGSERPQANFGCVYVDAKIEGELQ
jgi:hypothetical protein